MNKESLYNLVKMNNKEKVVLVKYGNFYKAYENDAILLWGLFGYRVIDGKISFPLSVFGTVVSKLTRLGMNVVVVKNENDINTAKIYWNKKKAGEAISWYIVNKGYNIPK